MASDGTSHMTTCDSYSSTLRAFLPAPAQRTPQTAVPFNWGGTGTKALEWYVPLDRVRCGIVRSMTRQICYDTKERVLEVI